MNMPRGLAAIALILLSAGCAGQKPAPSSNAPSPTVSTEFEKIKDPPINARTHFAAGQLAESQARLPEAVEQYKEAIRLDPKYADAMFRLGVVYAETSDFPLATQTWQKYIELTHGAASGYSNLGFCYELAGNPAAAEGAYKKGIEKDPKSEPCRVNYGLMLARHGRPNEGLLQLQAVLPAANAHYDLASVYEAMGQKKEAKREYQKALELDPTLDDAKARMASIRE
jgi:tetratricopeptide (TPR) repeat protein